MANKRKNHDERINNLLSFLTVVHDRCKEPAYSPDVFRYEGKTNGLNTKYLVDSTIRGTFLETLGVIVSVHNPKFPKKNFVQWNTRTPDLELATEIDAERKELRKKIYQAKSTKNAPVENNPEVVGSEEEHVSAMINISDYLAESHTIIKKLNAILLLQQPYNPRPDTLEHIRNILDMLYDNASKKAVPLTFFDEVRWEGSKKIVENKVASTYDLRSILISLGIVELENKKIKYLINKEPDATFVYAIASAIYEAKKNNISQDDIDHYVLYGKLRSEEAQEEENKPQNSVVIDIEEVEEGDKLDQILANQKNISARLEELETSLKEFADMFK